MMNNSNSFEKYIFSLKRIIAYFLMFFIVSISISKAENTSLDPIIATILPTSAKADSILTLTGQNFLQITTVIFPSVDDVISVDPIFISDTIIMVSVPLNIVSGIISIAGTNGSAESPQEFTYEKSFQTIVGLGENNTSYTYGSPDLIVMSGNTGNPLILDYISVPNKGVVSIVGNKFKIVGVGVATISGFQDSDENYESAFVERSIIITPKELKIAVGSFSRVYKSANPMFNGTVTGLINSETVTVNYLCNADINSSVGSYPIVCSVTGSSLKNYYVVSISGSLEIQKASQTINIPYIPDFELESLTGFITVMNISSSSGLPVELSVSGKGGLEVFNSGFAVIRVDSSGLLSLIGNQQGNENYNPAPQVIRDIEVTSKIENPTSVTGITDFKPEDFKIYPNPNNGEFFIDSPEGSIIQIFSSLGEEIQSIYAHGYRQPFFISQKGFYFLKVRTKTDGTFKVIKLDIQ